MEHASRGWIRWIVVPALVLMVSPFAAWFLTRCVGIKSDVVYGVVDGHRLLLDVYRPILSRGLHPAVILIHGGAWAAGDKLDTQYFAISLAREGFVCFAVDYRLATPTANHFPAQLDDVQRAVRWVRLNAGKYGVDPNRVGAFGHSAGAHLAALLGVRDTRDNSDPALARFSSRVNAVVDTCGPTDFSDPRCPPVFPVVSLDYLFGKSRDDAPELYRDASPALHVSPASSPFLLIHGTDDEVVPLAQSHRLAEALRAAGIEARLVELPGRKHMFFASPMLEQWRDETLAFFQRQLTTR